MELNGMGGMEGSRMEEVVKYGWAAKEEIGRGSDMAEQEGAVGRRTASGLRRMVSDSCCW